MNIDGDAGGLPLAGGTRIASSVHSFLQDASMGIYDRDWYREERRQQRSSNISHPSVAPDPKTSRKGPPGLSNARSLLIILAVFTAALIGLGLA